jgi:hypothetical protein
MFPTNIDRQLLATIPLANLQNQYNVFQNYQQPFSRGYPTIQTSSKKISKEKPQDSYRNFHAKPSISNRLRKTKLCRNFERGCCFKGANCDFAHGKEDLRYVPSFYKTQMCHAFLAGRRCLKGPQCRFAHGPHELNQYG